MKHRILHCESDNLVARAFRRFLEAHGFDVVQVSRASDALALLAAGNRYDAVLTSHRLDGISTGEGVLIGAQALGIPARILSGGEPPDSLAHVWIYKTDLVALDRFLAEVERGDEDTRHAGAQG